MSHLASERRPSVKAAVCLDPTAHLSTQHSTTVLFSMPWVMDLTCAGDMRADANAAGAMKTRRVRSRW